MRANAAFTSSWASRSARSSAVSESLAASEAGGAGGGGAAALGPPRPPQATSPSPRDRTLRRTPRSTQPFEVGPWASARRPTNRIDAPLSVRVAEHGRPRHEDVGPRRDHGWRGVLRDAPVHLDVHSQAALVDHPPQRRDLRHDQRQELLPPEPRIDAHDEDLVDALEQVLDGGGGRLGVQGDAGALPELTDPREG